MMSLRHPDSRSFYDTTLIPVSPGAFPPGEDTILYNTNSNSQMTIIWLSLNKPLNQMGNLYSQWLLEEQHS